MKQSEVMQNLSIAVYTKQNSGCDPYPSQIGRYDKDGDDEDNIQFIQDLTKEWML